jgi:hypothetical protein
VRERKSVRGANRNDGAAWRHSGRPFRGAQALQTGYAGNGSDQLNAAEMDKALDTGWRLPRIDMMACCHPVVVPGVHALHLSGTAPGHRAPGNRAQRKRRGNHRAQKTSNAVLHEDECCRPITRWQGWSEGRGRHSRSSGGHRHPSGRRRALRHKQIPHRGGRALTRPPGRQCPPSKAPHTPSRPSARLRRLRSLG